MKPFQFSLDKVLAWRRTQLRAEETRFKQAIAALQTVERQRAEALEARERSERQTIACASIDGGELAALSSFRDRVERLQKALLERRKECERLLAQQRSRYTEARRQVRLLEKLRERRLAEWQAGLNRELEDLAAETYLSQWNARQRGVRREVRQIEPAPAGIGSSPAPDTGRC